jgi:hypothetical protein
VASGRERVKGSCRFKTLRLATSLKGVIVSEITDKKPVELFDYTDLEKSYKDLIKKHHPDVGGSKEDFIHISQCYEIAKKEKEQGYSIGSNRICFYKPNVGVGSLDIDYKSVHEFSYGKVYDGPAYLAYEFPGKTMDDELSLIEGRIDYRTLSNKDIEEKVRIHLPHKLRTRVFKLEDRSFAVFNKTGPSMLLADVIPHIIPIETSVWMLNRLYGLGCFMQITKRYNLDISPYTLTVDLENHSVQLLGGWWYSVNAGDKLTKMPLTTYNLLTNKMKDTKMASIEIITEQIKNVMRTILSGRDIPKPYKNWLSLPAQENIVEEYYQWEHEVMKKIFPVRKFYKWTI